MIELKKLRAQLRRDARWTEKNFSGERKIDRAYRDGVVDGIESAVATINKKIKKLGRL